MARALQEGGEIPTEVVERVQAKPEEAVDRGRSKVEGRRSKVEGRGSRVEGRGAGLGCSACSAHAHHHHIITQHTTPRHATPSHIAPPPLFSYQAIEPHKLEPSGLTRTDAELFTQFGASASADHQRTNEPTNQRTNEPTNQPIDHRPQTSTERGDSVCSTSRT